MSQNIDDVVENVLKAVQCISSSVVGGGMNIRSLHLKAQDTPALPIYISGGMFVSLVVTAPCVSRCRI